MFGFDTVNHWVLASITGFLNSGQVQTQGTRGGKGNMCAPDKVLFKTFNVIGL